MGNGNIYPPVSNGRSETMPSSKQQWIVILEALAADKKWDLHPGTIELWKAKLRSYSANEIKYALINYKGQYFPSCDDIIELIEAKTARNTTVASKFVACGSNGCIDGWRPVSPEKFSRYQRCQCLIDHIRAVKGK